MKSFIQNKIIGWLLHNANKNVCEYNIHKHKFYELKTKLLKKYGKKIGTDIQHIKRPCRKCAGTGTFKSHWKADEKCWECNGSGIYIEFWSILESYRIGGYSFHNPIKKVNKFSETSGISYNNMIKGYIKHEGPDEDFGRECFLWLFFIFDREEFYKQLGNIYRYSTKYYPMLILDRLSYAVQKNITNAVEKALANKEERLGSEFDNSDLPF